MDIEIRDQPAYAVARATLDPGEAMVVEAGAMLAMTNLEIETKARGGMMRSLGRSVFGGESFFMNTFRAGSGGGELWVAPPLPGDMRVIEVAGELRVESGGFVAASEALQIDTKWSGGKGFFGSKDLIMLRITGTGSLVISAYGAIEEVNLAAGETFTIDTGHVVAFEPSVDFKVRKVGGLKSLFLSGEGLVVDLTGPGTVMMQTRSEESFLGWLVPKLPKSSS